MTAILELENHLGGRWSAGEGPDFTSTSPHDPDQVVAAGRSASTAQVDAALRSASARRRSWRRTPIHERATHLLRAADILDGEAAGWAPTMARESGKPVGECRGELARAAQILRYHAHQADAPAGTQFASPRAGERILVDHRPLGVVAVISPFNFPIAIPAWKIAPALVYGNTVVWKPPTSVAATADLLMRALEASGLPAGVLSLVHGDAEVGDHLVGAPEVDAVTFTGSTPVGTAIAARCAARGVPVQAEMGGKNAAVVLADADLDAAVAAVVSGAFRSAGQKCTATSRLVLHTAIADDFLERLTAAMAGVTVGDPEDESTYVGPLISASARDRVDAATSRAVEHGARLICRMSVPEGVRGHHCAPTVLEIASCDAELWQEELFGPVLAVLRTDQIDVALEAAASGPFALSLAVFGSDLGDVLDAIDEAGAGMVHINSETAGADPHVPFGGNGLSSFGPREQGASARDFYTTATTVYLQAVKR
ncbi:aldehyde dehydrogenase family protein [Gordonia sp. zg691]|uniref:aldehyde dehydrogenase family protein n=1 Tax=Gordonia jinghuaiqii TaxID=2758710 RepID=UPI0016625EEE|nr:aldehyde dehydrogenase family protein [Gordonia jinghuaiqii]MBD0860386.1 aldehyde dehydrogenase family protein [Gordonia jinghuaiqii]